MRSAADARIAPAVLHADAAAGAAIMAFVSGRPLMAFLADRRRLRGRSVLWPAGCRRRRCFRGEGGGGPVADYPAIVGGLLERLSGTGLYGSLLDPHRDGFERLREAYPWDESILVSSHNDPHPGNILFDGERLWLIDWESAYRNDPAVDLAIMTMYWRARLSCRRCCSSRGAAFLPIRACAPVCS